MGSVLRILPKTDYAMTTGLQLSSTITYTIGRRIDTSNFREAIGVLRVHSGTLMGNGAKVDLLWGQDG